MFIGQTLVAETYYEDPDVHLNETTVFSPWFDRLGNGAWFSMYVSALSFAVTDFDPALHLTIQTKKMDETDTQATDVETKIATATGIAKVLASDLEELVRYKFTLTENNVQVAKVFYATFHMLDPEWISN